MGLSVPPREDLLEKLDKPPPPRKEEQQQAGEKVKRSEEE